MHNIRPKQTQASIIYICPTGSDTIIRRIAVKYKHLWTKSNSWLGLQAMGGWRHISLNDLPLHNGHVLSTRGQQAAIVIQELDVGHMTAVPAANLALRLQLNESYLRSVLGIEVGFPWGTHLWLATRISEESDFAKVVSWSHKVLFVWSHTSIDICTISTLRPDSCGN